jgi:uncharacterized protein (DUF952 family)
MIYHVTSQEEWKAFENKDKYAPAAFLREGFIHACHSHQLQGVLQRYFAGRQDLLLLQIDEQKLACQLVAEPGTGGELFPHMYGEINKEAIVKIEALASSWL